MMSKNVRFSPFVTFLGEPDTIYPEMEDSFRLEGSVTNFLEPSTGRRRSSGTISGGSGRRRSSGSMGSMGIMKNIKRGSITMEDMFAMGDGSSGGFGFGFSGSDLGLGMEESNNMRQLSIREDDEDTDEEGGTYDEIALGIPCEGADFGEHIHFGNSSFPTTASFSSSSVEAEDTIIATILGSESPLTGSEARLATGTAS